MRFGLTAQLVALLLAPAALAQSGVPTRTDQTVEDLGPLSMSLRLIETGLAQPTGFVDLYRGDDPEQFYRASGALYATFPRSSYVVTRDGILPQVPAGTVFGIGALPMQKIPMPTMDARADASDIPEAQRNAMPGLVGGVRVDTRVLGSLEGAVVLEATPTARRVGWYAAERSTQEITAQPDRRGQSTVANDASYRSRRVRELMRRATGADRG